MKNKCPFCGKYVGRGGHLACYSHNIDYNSVWLDLIYKGVASGSAWAAPCGAQLKTKEEWFNHCQEHGQECLLLHQLKYGM